MKDAVCEKSALHSEDGEQADHSLTFGPGGSAYRPSFGRHAGRRSRATLGGRAHRQPRLSPHGHGERLGLPAYAGGGARPSSVSFQTGLGGLEFSLVSVEPERGHIKTMHMKRRKDPVPAASHCFFLNRTNEVKGRHVDKLRLLNPVEHHPGNGRIPAFPGQCCAGQDRHHPAGRKMESLAQSEQYRMVELSSCSA